MLCLSDSQPDSARPKNVPGPIRAALRVARHSVSLKNVSGPIAASTSVLDALNRPKKCSWTHLAGCSPPSPNCVQPEKCSWTYSGIAPLVGHRRCIPEKCSQTYREFTPSPWLNPVNPKNVHGPISPLPSALTKLSPT